MGQNNTEGHLVEKWGDGGLCLGWTAVPSALIFLQSRLGLTSTDINVLLNLMIHWWKPDDKIYPSQDSIANRIGVSKRTVQRTLDRLVEMGLIEVIQTKRNGRYKGRNIYNLRPLAMTIDSMAPSLKDSMGISKEKIDEE